MTQEEINDRAECMGLPVDALSRSLSYDRYRPTVNNRDALGAVARALSIDETALRDTLEFSNAAVVNSLPQTLRPFKGQIKDTYAQYDVSWVRAGWIGKIRHHGVLHKVGPFPDWRDVKSAIEEIVGVENG